MTLNDMNSQQRKEWAEKVFTQMQNKLKQKDYNVFFHAGKRYREYLIPELRRIGVHCTVPFKNLGIGEQLAWYNEKG